MPVVLREAQGGDLVHWCPGCDRVHILPWQRGGWEFNGDREKPTFTPSFKHQWPEWEGQKKVERVCHYIISAGVLNFCADSKHALAGQAMPMQPLPDSITWVK